MGGALAGIAEMCGHAYAQHAAGAQQQCDGSQDLKYTSGACTAPRSLPVAEMKDPAINAASRYAPFFEGGSKRDAAATPPYSVSGFAMLARTGSVISLRAACSSAATASDGTPLAIATSQNTAARGVFRTRAANTTPARTVYS